MCTLNCNPSGDVNSKTPLPEIKNESREERRFNGKTFDEVITELLEDKKINVRQANLLLERKKDYPKVHPMQILQIISQKKKYKKQKKISRGERHKASDLERNKNRDEKTHKNVGFLFTEMPELTDSDSSDFEYITLYTEMMEEQKESDSDSAINLKESHIPVYDWGEHFRQRRKKTTASVYELTESDVNACDNEVLEPKSDILSKSSERKYSVFELSSATENEQESKDYISDASSLNHKAHVANWPSFNFDSQSLRIKKLVSELDSKRDEASKSMSKLMKELFDIIKESNSNEKHYQWIHDLITIIIYSLSGHCNTVGFTTILSIMARNHGINPYVSHLMQSLGNLIPVLIGHYKTKFEPKTLSTEGPFAEAIEKILKDTSTLLQHGLVVQFLELTSHLASHHWFPKWAADAIYLDLCPKPTQKITRPKLLHMALTHVIQIISVVEDMCRGKTFEQALSKFNLSESLELLEAKIVAAYPNVFPGIPPEGCYTEQYVFTMCEQYISRASERMRITDNKHKNFAKFVASLETIKNIRANLEITINGRIRPTPFGVILFGESHIGKSYFIKLLQKEFLSVFNIEYSPSMIYSRDYQQEYWERYFGHPIVFYSELGSTAASIAQKEGDPGVAEFCSLIDNNEKQLTMAFQGKGSTPFRSLGVFGDGNDFDPSPNNLGKHLNIEYTVSNPGAVANRFVYPTLVVKEEYRLPNSKSIDPSKALHNPDRWFDIYDFEMWESEKAGFKQMKFKKTYHGDIDGFITYYKTLVLKHFINQDKANENINKALHQDIYGIASEKSDPVQKILRACNSVFSHVYGPKDRQLIEYDGDIAKAKDEIIRWIRNEKLIQHETHIEYLHKGLISHLSKDPDYRVRELVTHITAEDFKQDFLDDNNTVFGPVYHTLATEGNKLVKKISWKIPGKEYDVLEIPEDVKGCSSRLDELRFRAQSITIEEFKSMDDSVAAKMADEILTIQDYLYHLKSKKEFVPKRITHKLKKLSGVLSLKETKEGLLDRVDKIKNSVSERFNKYVTEEPSTHMSSVQLYAIKWLTDSKISPWLLIFNEMPLSEIGGFMIILLYLWWNSLVSLIILFFVLTFMYYVNVAPERLAKCQNAGKDVMKQLELRRRNAVCTQILEKKGWSFLLQKAYYPAILGVSAYTIYKILQLCDKAFSYESRKVEEKIQSFTNIPLQNENEKENKKQDMIKNDKKNIIELKKNSYVSEGAMLSVINEIEEKSDCSLPYPRVKNKLLPSQWNVVDTVNLGGIKCASEAQFLNRIRNGQRSIRIVGILKENGKQYQSPVCHGFGVGNFFLFPYHYIKNFSSGEIYLQSVVRKEKDIKIFSIGRDTVYVLREDLCAIKIHNLSFTDTSQDFSVDLVHEFGGIILGEEVSCKLEPLVNIVDSISGNSQLQENLYIYNCVSYSGKCGQLLYRRIKDRFIIMGMHNAGNQSQYGSCVPIFRKDFELLKDKSQSTLIVPLPTKFISCDSDSDGVLFTESLPPLICVNTNPHFRSAVNYEQFDYLNYHGQIKDIVTFPSKSDVVPTGIDKELLRLAFNRVGLSIEKEYMPPLMKATKIDDKWISPINVNLIDINRADTYLDPKICRAVIDEMSRIYTFRIREAKGADFVLKPIPMHIAINGLVEDKILRKIDLSKAGGFGYPGKKNKYFVEFEGNQYPVDKLELDIALILKTYAKGESYPQIFKGTLKDEPRSVSKVKSAQTRLFFASSLPHLIVERMFLAPLMTLKIEIDNCFDSAIGIDTHREMDHFLEQFARFENKSTIGLLETSEALELDYRGFDKETCTMVTTSALSVVVKLLDNLGYNHYSMTIVKSMLSDSIRTHFSVNGDLYSRFGLFPSGRYATAEINDFRNTFMIVYALHHMVYPHFKDQLLEFPDVLCHRTYGDDLLGVVKKEFKSLFNNVTYSKFCMEHYGVVCTTANKSAEMQPFIPFLEASFLKRTFKYHDRLDRIVGLLEPASMFKTLTWMIPSSSVDRMTQFKQMVESVMRELYFHLDFTSYNNFGHDLMLLVREQYEIEANWIPDYYKLEESLLITDNVQAQLLRGSLEVNKEQVSPSA